MDNNTPQQDTQAPDAVEMNGLDTFVPALTAWHEGKVAILKHMQGIPDAVEITADVGDGPVALSGDLLKGFKFGLAFAIGEIGTLPFSVEYEDEPATQPG